MQLTPTLLFIARVCRSLKWRYIVQIRTAIGTKVWVVRPNRTRNELCFAHRYTCQAKDSGGRMSPHISGIWRSACFLVLTSYCIYGNNEALRRLGLTSRIVPTCIKAPQASFKLQQAVASTSHHSALIFADDQSHCLDWSWPSVSNFYFH